MFAVWVVLVVFAAVKLMSPLPDAAMPTLVLSLAHVKKVAAGAPV